MQSTISNTLAHVMFLARHLDKCAPRGAIIAFLMELRVPTKCNGFELLKRAVLLKHQDPTRALAKDIYLEIALHYKLHSDEQVEQAIRDAIGLAWKHGSKKAWDWYFSYDGFPAQHRPSNSEFISRLAYVLELWQECKKEGRYDR